jgi:predicted MFS family arabinose efflux permease
MQNEAGLSHEMAGFVASSNMAGYLLGALAATAPVFRSRRLATVRGALIIVILTTAVMAVPSPLLWLLARFATGVASGFSLVLGSSIVLDRALRERRPDWIAIFYSGVGLGIVVSAVAIPLFASHRGWQAGWVGIGLISAIVCAITLPWFSDDRVYDGAHRGMQTDGRFPRLFWWLLTAYGGEGMGYIIPATFMVAMVAATPGVAAYATWSWIVVGLVAMPSTVLWNRAGLAIGRAKALAISLAVMGAGVVAPIAAPNVLGVVVAAVTLGGTFMGATALANALGHQLSPRHSQIAIGRLTTSFGVGQIAGPAVAGALVGATGSYTAALVVAGAVLCASAAIMFCGSHLGEPISAGGTEPL